MKVQNTKFNGYTLATDYYPYTETKKILQETSWWWEHQTRKKNLQKLSNYSLDTNLRNSIGFSLEHRLQNGEFNFLFYKDQLISYSGLRVDKGMNSWLHRGAAHPILGYDHVGASMAILMPHQANISKLLGYLSYNISFNGYNFKFYKYYRDKHYYIKKPNLPGGEKFMDAFEWRENVSIMGINQNIGTLDLTRPDIDNILNIGD